MHELNTLHITHTHKWTRAYLEGTNHLNELCFFHLFLFLSENEIHSISFDPCIPGFLVHDLNWYKNITEDVLISVKTRKEEVNKQTKERWCLHNVWGRGYFPISPVLTVLTKQWPLSWHNSGQKASLIWARRTTGKLLFANTTECHMVLRKHLHLRDF